MRETWYVMEDGSCANPREISRDENGKLVHRDGRKVAYAPHGPRSRGVDVPEAKEMRPARTGLGYVTRESNAERAAPDADLVAARAEYEAATGKRAYHGWSAAKLREKIAEHKPAGDESGQTEQTA